MAPARAAAAGNADADAGATAERSLLAALQRGDEATAHALAQQLTERFPERGVAWKVWGALLWATGRTDEAVAAMKTSARLLPQDAEAHCNLGLSLAKLERLGAAERHLRRAIDIDPGFAPAHYRLGMVHSLQGRPADAAASLRRGLELRTDYTSGDDVRNHSNLLFILSHDAAVDAAALAAAHRAFGIALETPLRAGWPAHANDRDPVRPLRIGLVSGDLYDHSVGQFLEPIAAALAARASLELHAYCSHPQDDAVSRRLRTHFASWTAVDGLDDPALARRIQADRIDILIDLCGHTAHNRLPVFARKPAPLQASWLGYPGSTGLGAVDYYLADPCWLPPGRFDGMFTEKLVYLPDRWAFRPHAAAPPVGPSPALRAGRLTFGSFHRRGKLSAATIALWSRVLNALPDARLLIVGIPVDAEARSLLEQFAALGIDPARLGIHERCAMDRYLAWHHEVDIALDTLGFAGATTTMHSLSMGVPTLTLAGTTPQGRACAGILEHLGLDAFIAADADRFIDQARFWAARVPALAALRASLRDRLVASPGGRPAFIAGHLESALRHMWRRWCAGLPAESFHSQTTPEANS